MAIAYWNIVMKDRFKFLEIWCTFLRVCDHLRTSPQYSETCLKARNDLSIKTTWLGPFAILYKDHLSIKTTWLGPFAIDFDLYTETTSL